MTTPFDPTPGPAAEGAPPEPPRTELPPDPVDAPDQTAGRRRRPWGWIAVCGVLALVAVGVTIWALSLNSDLNHQRDQTAAAQQQAEQASSQADQISSQVDQLTQDINDALDQAGQAGAAAKDQLQGALADLKDRLSALADEAKPPAAGSGSPAAAATPTATATPVENATPGGP